jgi:hypothetical protein
VRLQWGCARRLPSKAASSGSVAQAALKISACAAEAAVFARGSPQTMAEAWLQRWAQQQQLLLSCRCRQRSHAPMASVELPQQLQSSTGDTYAHVLPVPLPRGAGTGTRSPDIGRPCTSTSLPACLAACSYSCTS